MPLPLNLLAPVWLWGLLILPLLLALVWRQRAVPRLVVVLRLLWVALLVFSLAQPVLGAIPSEQPDLVVLLDQSDSVSAEARTQARQQADNLVQTANAANQRIAVISFGSVARSGSAALADDERGATDLAQALASAHALLPLGGRVVLFSDGIATQGEVGQNIERLAVAGVHVDVMHLPVAEPYDAAVVALLAPRYVRVGEEYAVQVQLSLPEAKGNQPLVAALQLWEGTHLLADQPVEGSGFQTLAFRSHADTAGVLQLRARVQLEGDSVPQNDTAYAAVPVIAQPHILIVASQPDRGNELKTALLRDGLESDVILPANLPTRLQDLEGYDGMMLVNVPAFQLSLDQMGTVREFVRSEGRGLVAIGGQSSFGLGGYKDTPLEQALPLTADPPPQSQRPDIALLLIVDRSASMTAAYGISKFDMAREAGILATEVLRPTDHIGVLAFDTRQEWIVPFQTLGEGASLKAVQDAIATLPAGGGTDIFGALSLGLEQIYQEDVPVRHVMLLTDGRMAINNDELYRQLLERARAEKVTVSTIAIGADADSELLTRIAEQGGGRFYYAAEPADIPRLTLAESSIARIDPTVEEDFQARLDKTHPVLRGLSPADFPTLNGYVAATARPQADIVLRTGQGDPLLAVWQYGLGRSLAWTSSSGAPWAKAWPAWGEYGRFWSQMVRYTLPEPNQGMLQARVEPLANGFRLVAEVSRNGVEPINLADVQTAVTTPDGNHQTVHLTQSAPGRYTQDIVRAAAGAYSLQFTLRDGDRDVNSQIGYVVSPPLEYLATHDANRIEAGEALLQSIAALTGGRVLKDVKEIGVGTRIQSPMIDLWPILVSLALVLFLVEIAVRRGVLRLFKRRPASA